MKKHVISITGDLASGKGVVSLLLKRDLNYIIYRNGEYVRKLAKEKNMNIIEFQEYLNENPDIDNQIEESAREFIKENDNVIIEARLGWYAVPDSFKVYLKTDIDISASRAFNDEKRFETEKYIDIQNAKEKITYRANEENERFFRLYNIRRDDMSNYDLVIDTSKLTPEEVNTIIKDEYFKWLNKDER